MKVRAADFLEFDKEANVYRVSPEQAVRDDVEKHYWRHVGVTILKDWRLYLMLVPMILVFLFWRYFPMYELLGCFKVSDSVVPVSEQLFSGFSYFKRLLVGGDTLSTEFWRALRNTFILSFYGLCFGFPIPIILALFFNEIRSNAARSVYQVLTYLPKFMSTVVMTSLVTMLVKQGSLTTGMGIVSQAMESLGLISHEVANAGLLNNPAFFRSIYQISGIWESAGYDSIVFFAAIIAISPTSYEAAQIDGASRLQLIRHITLPSIVPSVITLVMLNVSKIFFSDFGLFYQVPQNSGAIYSTTNTIDTYVYRALLQQNNPSMSAAAGFYQSIVGFVLVLAVNALVRKFSKENALF